jgi:hypothetical protein
VFFALAAILGLSGCAATRELNIDHPVSKPTPLPPLGGAPAVDGDDYYVQFVSEFDYQGDADWKAGCRDFGGGYAKGGAASKLVFQVRNEALRFSRETPALAFQSTAGRCAISLEAKKVYLTPWMRLDMGKDAQIDYSFITSNSGALDLGGIGSDVNTASNVLALTGVGTGVAIMGKLASGWMLNSSQTQTAAGQGQEQGRRRQETRSLPPLVRLGASGGTLNPAVFKVYELAESKLNPLPAEPKPVGELAVRADVKSSLLLRTAANGLPDARDLSLDELWRSQIQTGAGVIGLREFIARAEHPERPNLEPDWNNYREVEAACRKLKVAMKDLGFNRFDRNAVLYYFLDKAPEWRNYNVAGQNVLAGDYKLGQLQQFRARGFGNCLIAEDYETMKAMGLAVNGPNDWAALLRPAQDREAYFGAIRALERQLTAAIGNPNVGEMEHQLFPLVGDSRNGAGKVLFQDRLGNFGLERILNAPTVPGQGVVLTAAQLAQVFASLRVAELSCARPAFEQGRPVPNVAILAFATAEGSPLARGGALEYEFDGARIVRLAIQSPAFRDFRQSALSHPEIGDCRIDSALLERL